MNHHRPAFVYLFFNLLLVFSFSVHLDFGQNPPLICVLKFHSSVISVNRLSGVCRHSTGKTGRVLLFASVKLALWCVRLSLLIVIYRVFYWD